MGWIESIKNKTVAFFTSPWFRKPNAIIARATVPVSLLVLLWINIARSTSDEKDASKRPDYSNAYDNTSARWFNISRITFALAGIAEASAAVLYKGYKGLVVSVTESGFYSLLTFSVGVTAYTVVVGANTGLFAFSLVLGAGIGIVNMATSKYEFSVEMLKSMLRVISLYEAALQRANLSPEGLAVNPETGEKQTLKELTLDFISYKEIYLRTLEARLDRNLGISLDPDEAVKFKKVSAKEHSKRATLILFTGAVAFMLTEAFHWMLSTQPEELSDDEFNRSKFSATIPAMLIAMLFKALDIYRTDELEFNNRFAAFIVTCLHWFKRNVMNFSDFVTGYMYFIFNVMLGVTFYYPYTVTAGIKYDVFATSPEGREKVGPMNGIYLTLMLIVSFVVALVRMFDVRKLDRELLHEVYDDMMDVIELLKTSKGKLDPVKDAEDIQYLDQLKAKYEEKLKRLEHKYNIVESEAHKDKPKKMTGAVIAMGDEEDDTSEDKPKQMTEVVVHTGDEKDDTSRTYGTDSNHSSRFVGGKKEDYEESPEELTSGEDEEEDSNDKKAEAGTISTNANSKGL